MKPHFKFYPKYREDILKDLKRATVRKNNYQQIESGDQVDLFVGKEKLKSVKIKSVSDIKIENGIIFVNGEELNFDDENEFLSDECHSTKMSLIKSLSEYFEDGLINGKLFRW
jgi:hypothetical protein